MVRTWTGNNQNNYKAATSIWGIWDSWDMDGLGGDDTLIGGEKNDTLNGNTGNDEMRGGLGDDIYHVDSVYDQVTEYANQGTDTVISSINYTLGSNLENLKLEGSALNGFGNDLNNIIDGNDLNNIILGHGGHDTLKGHWGNDTLRGGIGNDSVHGGEHNDYLHGDEGDDTLTGAKDNDVLLGGAGNDVLNGGDGIDYLYGDTAIHDARGQIDTLTGGANTDYFILGTRDGEQAFYNDDNNYTSGWGDYALMTDFVIGEDIIHLKGSPNDYRLETRIVSGIGSSTTAETLIFLDTSPYDANDELIAIAQDVSGLSLSSNSGHFYFV